MLAGKPSVGNGGKGKGRETMNAVIRRMKSFLASEDGPTATEYAVMLALIIIVCLVAITGLGEKVRDIFSNVDSNLDAGAAGTH